MGVLTCTEHMTLEPNSTFSNLPIQLFSKDSRGFPTPRHAKSEQPHIEQLGDQIAHVTIGLIFHFDL